MGRIDLDHQAYLGDTLAQIAAEKAGVFRDRVPVWSVPQHEAAWAVLERARTAGLGARIVLCLHDELLVHAPLDAADTVREIVDDGVAEARYRWAPDTAVRFVADTTVVARWSDAT